MDSKLWWNGRLVPQDEAAVPFLTHGLHYGSAVFEGIRVYDGKIFQLREHIERFMESARLMGMVSPFTLEQYMQGCVAVVEAQQLQVGYIRPLMWRGSDTLRICAPDIAIEAAIAAWHVPTTLTTKDAFIHKAPTTMTMAHWRRPPANCAPSAAKASGLYVIATLAVHAAREKGFQDALMLDYRGLIAEATSSNIFFVLDGAIHTPTPDCFLNGITRQTVIQLAKNLTIPVYERPIEPEILAQAQEVFLTGTTSEILPVSNIDAHTYALGDTTRALMAAFYDFVQSSIQIQG